MRRTRLGQKRGEGDFFAFAAFFSAKGAVATALWAVLPVRKVLVSTTGHRPVATGHAKERMPA